MLTHLNWDKDAHTIEIPLAKNQFLNKFSGKLSDFFWNPNPYETPTSDIHISVEDIFSILTVYVSIDKINVITKNKCRLGKDCLSFGYDMFFKVIDEELADALKCMFEAIDANIKTSISNYINYKYDTIKNRKQFDRESSKNKYEVLMMEAQFLKFVTTIPEKYIP